MFLVMGITGRVGGATARHLLGMGKRVRALVRDRAKAAAWEKKGVELVGGDWTDADAIAKALHGVEGAYVMMPPIMTPSRDFREAKAVIAAHREALAKAPPPRLVALSSWGSEQAHGLGLITSTALMEHGLRDLPMPVVFLRAGGFYENMLYGLQAGQGGTLPVFNASTTRALAFVATTDIGAEAAERLTGPGWKGARIVELGSMVSPDAIAMQLGEVLGREVKAQPMPRDTWGHALEHMGIPKQDAWAFEEMTEAIDSGWIHFGVGGTEKVESKTSAREVFAEAHAP